MTSEFKKRLKIALRKVILNDWNPSKLEYKEIEYRRITSPSILEKVNLYVSLCNYYNCDKEAPEIIEDLKLLSESIIDYELLEKLTENLDRLTSKSFSWHPDFHHLHREEMAQNITLSPTFQIGDIDLASLLTEIEKIRTDIKSRKINLNSLISFILRKAKESSDLDDINQNS